ncbi:MAG: B12-binding domain-containing radical SAM protein [Desulfobacterales bacterium]|nr:B12-binding domain-containing radical SAM protein [Desulfobacterales bacterium]
MKILLINPPNSGKSIPEEQYGITTIKMIFRGEPLALETLAGNLTGHEVRICDLKVTPDGLAADLSDMAPDIVGITGMTCEANAVLAIAESVKSLSGAVVVVGGHHATCDPEFFNRGCIDYVVLGVGKQSFRELVDGLESDPGNDIAGIAKTRPGSPLTFSPRKYGPADLVDGAPPRYDLVAHHRDHYVMHGVGGKIGFVASAFGCTHRCFFCSVPAMTGGRYLTHSVDAVVRDMTLLADIPVIRLVDANTFGDPAMAENLARRILEAGMSKPLVADVRSDTVVRQPELFRLWKEAGLATAVIGFEEITDERLQTYNKKSDVAVNVRAMEILKDLGIRIIGDFIVSPDYGEADFTRLYRFVQSHPIDLPIPSILTPVPGTPLYRKVKHRITIHDLDYYTFLNAVVPTRLPEKDFYEAYSDLLKRCLSRASH